MNSIVQIYSCRADITWKFLHQPNVGKSFGKDRPLTNSVCETIFHERNHALTCVTNRKKACFENEPKKALQGQQVLDPAGPSFGPRLTGKPAKFFRG
jgi:hypothetical protein